MQKSGKPLNFDARYIDTAFILLFNHKIQITGLECVNDIVKYIKSAFLLHS